MDMLVMMTTNICDSMYIDLQTSENCVLKHVYVRMGAQIPGARSAKQ